MSKGIWKFKNMRLEGEANEERTNDRELKKEREWREKKYKIQNEAIDCEEMNWIELTRVMIQWWILS